MLVVVFGISNEASAFSWLESRPPTPEDIDRSESATSQKEKPLIA